MRHKRIENLIVGGALISALLITASSVFAYDQNNTHPALTDEIVDFYNLNFPDKKLTNQEKQWLIQGAVEEDTGERPLFHFYDPVYNRGIAHFSSKEWALKPSAQANYYNSQLTGFAAISGGDSANDFSYERALNDYAKGDKERAFVAFGHTLHLLEDAGVPDHTRNDAHPSFIHGQESPYEHEMAKWNPNNFQIARKLFLTREKPVIFGTMVDYFNRIANYSNNNFFSKDTISSGIYNSPNINNAKNIVVNKKEKFFIVGKDRNGEEFPLAFLKLEKNGQSFVIKNVSLIDPEIGSYILDGYWDRLSKEVVLNGAGALNLFLTEAEKAKIEYVNRPPEKPSWFARLLGLIGTDRLTTRRVVSPQGVDNSNNSDSMVTPTPKVTNQSVSPKSLVTKTPVTNVTTPTPSVSPLKTPAPKISTTPTPKLTTSDGQRTSDVKTIKITGRVVINEIAWAGTSASATDEWIELYNSENYDIDLSGWTLKAEDGTPEIFVEEGKIIKAQSYFLLERTNDMTVNSILSDQLYVGALGNEGEFLKLSDSSSTVVDTAGNSGGAWPAGGSTGKISMERTSGGWKNFTGNPSAKDANGNFINGTPKAVNSIAVVTFSSGGGGGGGSSSTSTPTPTPLPTPTPSPSVTPTPTPIPTPDPSSPLLQVVISEIAWMGTSASLSSDEWMELYNTTNQTVDMSGWTLKATDGTPNITLSGNISPYGFYLLERTDDTTVSDILSDKKDPFYTGALGNGGEYLELKDASGNLQDFIDGSSAWFDKGTTSPDYKSMERINPKQSGNDSANWAINNGTIKNGLDAAGNPINGTPRAQNSVYVALKPSAITNLAVTGTGGNFGQFSLTWSAPEDLDTLPANLSYDLRYATKSFATLDDWDTAYKLASASLSARRWRSKGRLKAPLLVSAAITAQNGFSL